ncbi:glycine cleavage system aminomethyltransferase GcvT [Alphaproteobacteria bacterium KMM 3653]|uniref:aminomethyltransferase n=1 Tax=Harenicola maris TaxID=2841044 RepID=A0AAP2G5N7_9RHOB|nr:glycine cleavage system aminomethyltransferase GcvT [Harenicola maris]
MTDLAQTPLYDLHLSLGAKMVEFAGYSMPVQYPLGVMKEHLFCRQSAGLFDVSHMGQLRVEGPGAAHALEALIPVDILGLGEGRQRYGFFTGEGGGILDDLMIANRGDHLFVVVNAACKAEDIAHMQTHLSPDVTVTPITDRALIALQGPAAEAALSALNPAAKDMAFMDVATMELAGVECWVSRSGYTGEDGYEISVPEGAASDLAQTLLARDDVEPIGLGARDSLRLEAGLCLYGHDITQDTSPIEAALTWAISKVRRPGGARAGGFMGADAVFSDLAEGTARKRVGLLPEGRAPMREGVSLYASEDSSAQIGVITSGSFGPTIGGPVAMGYVGTAQAKPGTAVFGELRGKRLPLTVTKLPFTPANFKR